MYISRFFIAGVAMIVVMMLIVSLGSDVGSFSLSLFSFKVTFPTAVWVAIPAVLMMVAAIGHMLYYSALRYYRQRGDEKELKALGELFMAAKEGKPYAYPFKNCTIKQIAQSIDPKSVEKDSECVVDECEEVASGQWGRNAAKVFRQWVK